MKPKSFETTFHTGQSLQVLMVDAFTKDAERASHVLSKYGYRVNLSVVSTQEQFTQAVSQHHYDVILSEFHLANWTAREALEWLGSVEQAIPFIVVTRYLRDSDAAEVIDAGADDYIFKNSLYRLPLAVRRVLREHRLYGELKRSAEERERLIIKLEETLSEVKRLNGLLPVCVTCKRVLNTKGYWKRIENYIEEFSEARISPSLCPQCRLTMVPHRN